MLRPPTGATAATGLEVPNLLNDLDMLGALLQTAAAERMWLDAYLLVAGMHQIVEDHLHDAPYPLDQASEFLRDAGSPPACAIAMLPAAAAGGARAWAGHGPGARRVIAWWRTLDRLVQELADVVQSGTEAQVPLAERCTESADEIRHLPRRLRCTVLRLPACFHQFDQRPEDLDELARRALAHRPPTGPVLVVGVRTSGSYLAPLIAASLRARGASGSRSMTIRPGRPLSREERMRLRWCSRERGSVLVTDDPPVTGRSIKRAVRMLEAAGVASDSIVLGLALQNGAVPEALRGCDAVILPRADWHVQELLGEDVVRRELEALLADTLAVEVVRALPLPAPANRRGHAQALYEAEGRDAEGVERNVLVLARSTGLGYFGAHGLAVARALGRLVPRVYGLRDGVLYREWLADEQRIRDTGLLARSAAAYVDARRRRLPAPRDTTLSTPGERPAWEVAGLVLASAFGRAAPLARVLFVDQRMRRLLRVQRPTVIDGSTGPENWFARDPDHAVKAHFSERTHWSLGLGCFDPVFDLAGVAVEQTDGELAAEVRAAWSAQTGESVEPERWLLYELAHLWGKRREDPAREQPVRFASATATQRYFSATFFADHRAASEGELWALDVDGVLETEQLGFPALTRASARALRALIAHGYRPVLATGRGIEEVRSRCRAYGLPGGVAEYGSAVYVEAGERTISVVEDAQAEALRRLRAELRGRPGVHVDATHRFSVRAYRRDADGARAPLSSTETEEFLRVCRASADVRAIVGDNQTDFVASSVDKAAGLRALCRLLDPADGEHRTRIAFAVGDTVNDRPMLQAAERAFVPSHAEVDVAPGAVRVDRPYQAGFWRAVAQVLGHPPGGCARCRLAPETEHQRLLLDLVSAAESGRRNLVFRALAMAVSRT